MSRLGLFPFLLLAACTAGPVPGPAPRGDPSATLLLAHNRERSVYGARQLVWDQSLAAGAAAYGRQLAGLGQLRHSARSARPGQGENLWMGTRGAFPVQHMVASWVSEKAYFRPGVFPAVSSTGNWAMVGHFTQMIWPTTTRVGCALASSPRYDVLVCRYAPAGNVEGRRVP